MDSKVINSEQLNFKGEEFARLSYDMLFEDQASGEEEENPSLEEAVEETSTEELSERLREVEEEWGERLEEEREKAARAAYDRGKEHGREVAESSMEKNISTLKSALEEADRKIDEMLEELKPEMARMVFDLAEKVVRVPLEDEEIRRKVSRDIEEVLDKLEEGIRVKIKVSESDYRAVEEKLGGCGNRVELSSGEELNPGEYSIDTRKERVVKQFTKILDDFRESVALTDDESYNEVA